MGMWDAQSDRDHADECHGPYTGERTVPCKLCRAPVQVESRTHSIFATVLCQNCSRIAQATQDRKMDQGAA